ncbi:MAG: hypothetical protein ACOYL6_11355 [Bacteriovoracaceae bacterium]
MNNFFLLGFLLISLNAWSSDLPEGVYALPDSDPRARVVAPEVSNTPVNEAKHLTQKHNKLLGFTMGNLDNTYMRKVGVADFSTGALGFVGSVTFLFKEDWAATTRVSYNGITVKREMIKEKKPLIMAGGQNVSFEEQKEGFTMNEVSLEELIGFTYQVNPTFELEPYLGIGLGGATWRVKENMSIVYGGKTSHYLLRSDQEFLVTKLIAGGALHFRKLSLWTEAQYRFLDERTRTRKREIVDGDDLDFKEENYGMINMKHEVMVKVGMGIKF